MERRAFPVKIETRKGGDAVTISGHAAVFDSYSEDLGGFREIIRPGAFAKTIGEADIRALWNHDTNYVLGRNRANTLSLTEDGKGLAVEITPPDTGWARDLVTTIQRGDVDQMSFGFRVVQDRWRTEDKQPVRELLEVELFDVSPVTFPAYPETQVQARAILRSLLLAGTDEETEKALLQRVLEQMSTSEPDQTLHSGAGSNPPVSGEPRHAPHSVLQMRMLLLERML